MNFSVIRSRTFWTVVLMFIVGGLNAVLPVIPVGAQVFVQGLLAVLAMYFKFNPSQNYNSSEE